MSEKTEEIVFESTTISCYAESGGSFWAKPVDMSDEVLMLMLKRTLETYDNTWVIFRPEVNEFVVMLDGEDDYLTLYDGDKGYISARTSMNCVVDLTFSDRVVVQTP